MASQEQSCAAAVDLVHLDRYTGGVRALNEEILSLFDRQCLEMLDKLEDLAGAEGKGWREVTHTLKGAARGIGAFGLADIAASAEKLEDRAQQLAIISQLKDKSAQVHAFIEEFLAGAAGA